MILCCCGGGNGVGGDGIGGCGDVGGGDSMPMMYDGGGVVMTLKL